MRIERDGYGVHVFLSRRNVETLLAKLDGYPPDSACTIVGPALYDEAFAVTAEEDCPHYDHESRGEVRGEAGTMHPDTEIEIGNADPFHCAACGRAFPLGLSGSFFNGTGHYCYPACPEQTR